MIVLVAVKDFEFIADQNNQRNYKPPPINFSNTFLWFRLGNRSKRQQKVTDLPDGSIVVIDLDQGIGK